MTTPDLTPALAIRGVSKRFGRVQALDNLDLEVGRGSIFGFVGPNGAGKTTTFAIICGFLRPDQGQVQVLGEGPFHPAIHRGRVTALPQDAALGRDLPLEEQLAFFAMLQGVPRHQVDAHVDRVLELADMKGRARDRSRTLSHGMLRRVGIAQAFLGNPELILLDEPTNGLDPRQAHHIRTYIASQRGRATIIVSSHNLAEIESICDHVALIDHGKVVRSGPITAVTGRNEEINITLGLGPVPVEPLQQALPGEDVTWEAEGRILSVRFQPKAEREAEDVIGQALAVLLAQGARIAAVSKGQSLERTYLESTVGEGQDRA